MRNLSRVAIFLLFLFPTLPVSAANPLDLVINEIAWMGTEVSYNDEWVELYNNTDTSISLDGWILKAVDGTPKINLKGTISGRGFYLLERTDDDTVPNIPADQIYTGALGNNGENLQLYDNSGNLIDSVDCGAGWFAGDNSTKQTMERKDSLSESDSDNWTTSQNPGGTPKAKNSVAIEFLQPPEEQIIEPEVQPEPQPELITYPSGIIINEILPSPEGPDEKEEWVEIFNQNSFEVSLANWQITDIEGKINTYTFLEGVKISPQGFLVLSRPTTKITLNNDGDGLNLLQPDGKTIDSVSYEKAPRGQSFNRIDSKWVWSTTLTPGSANIIPTPIETEKVELPKVKESALEKEIPELKPKKGLAAIAEQIPEEDLSSFFVFLIALSLAIFSGIIILILKRKVKGFDFSKN